MKTVTLCLAMAGLLFSAGCAATGNGGIAKEQTSQAVHVQGLTGIAAASEPSAFGGTRGTLYSLAETVRN